MTSHTRNGIVQDDYGGCSLIIYDIDKPGNSGMNKSGITDNCDGFSSSFAPKGFFHTVRYPYAGTHAYTGIHSFKRSQCAECIATDITRYPKLVLLQNVENTTVGTTWAKYR